MLREIFFIVSLSLLMATLLSVGFLFEISLFVDFLLLRKSRVDEGKFEEIILNQEPFWFQTFIFQFS